jgi:hypothetical protein
MARSLQLGRPWQPVETIASFAYFTTRTRLRSTHTAKPGTFLEKNDSAFEAR